MPKFFFYPVVVILGSLLLGWNLQSNYITWDSEFKLSWKEFQAKSPEYPSHAALSHTGISLDLKEENGLMEIEVEARFDKTKSWKSRNDHTGYLLAHEQLHFDITEVYARKMRKKILEHNWIEEKDWVSSLETLFQENQDELWSFQARYDKETNHSLKREVQLMWDMAIADSLSTYSDFKESGVSVRVR